MAWQTLLLGIVASVLLVASEGCFNVAETLALAALTAAAGFLAGQDHERALRHHHPTGKRNTI